MRGLGNIVLRTLFKGNLHTTQKEWTMAQFSRDIETFELNRAGFAGGSNF